MADGASGSGTPTPGSAEAAAAAAAAAAAGAGGAGAGAGTGTGTGDAGAGTGTPPTPKPVVVPDKYDLSLPKDAVIAAPTLERLATAARGAGLSNEMAQGVLAFVNQEVAAELETRTKAWAPGGEMYKKQVDEYTTAALADAEIGGSPEKLKASVDVAVRVLDTFFPPAIKQFLETTGFGSNPDVIRGFAKVGRAFGEGRFTAPPKPAAGDQKRAADVMYDHPTSKAEG